MKLPRLSLAPDELLFALAGAAIPLLSLLLPRAPVEVLVPGVVYALAIAFIFNFPFVVLGREITLVQVVALGIGLLYGPRVAFWASLAGLLLGTLIQHQTILPLVTQTRPPTLRTSVKELLTNYGALALPLAGAFALPGWTQGIAFQPEILHTQLGRIALVLVVFTVFHTALFWADYRLNPPQALTHTGRDLVLLALVEGLPAPFLLIALLAYPDLKIGTLAALGGIPAAFAVLMYGMSTARADLERRLQDLSTLNNISRTLRSTLDTGSLLTVIHEQVTQLLKVDSFYVALYNLEGEYLWYPLAVKNGERQNWPQRPLADRLTDRVILERKPIMLARQAQDELARIGLPPGQEAMNAWLGVPLITPERAIGCLAVFSASPEMQFTPADLNLLTTLSGQVSVAIENALLFEKAQHRAAQLERLNQISSLITASLNLEEVLMQVCESVTQVGGGQRSALYLLDPDEGRVWLAHSQGLSTTFTAENDNYSAAHHLRTRCLRTGQPVLVENIQLSDYENTFRDSLLRENLRAFGDFPLSTPDGQIGFLSVFFETAQRFSGEQVELLQTFASQAALAVANARLHAYTDMALTRRAHQLSILEAIGRELSAVIHSERLFQVILDYALEFTNSPWGSLVIYDAAAQTMEIVAEHGYAIEQRAFQDTQGITGRVIRTKKPVNIEDVRQDKDYIDVTRGEARSQLSVPLIHEGRVLGVLTLESPKPNAFDSNDQGFISQLATQAAIAVVNAELYKETQRRLREQASLYLVSTHLVGNLELGSVLRTVAQAIGAALEASITGVYLWNENEDAYTLKEKSQATYLKNTHFLPASITGGQLRANYPNMQKTNTLRLYQTEERLETLLNVCQECQALILPLTISGQHYGIVVTHLPKTRQLTTEEKQLPRAIAAQGSIALQNALLFTDVTQGRDRLQAVLDSVGDGVLMVEAGGYITLANAPIAALTGIQAQHLIGTPFIRLPETALQTLGYTRAQALDLLKTLEQGRAPSPAKTVTHITHSGPEKVLESATEPVWGQSKRLIGLIFVVRNVTEEHEINQARELITHTLVHDLKSPLGAILSSLQIITEVAPSGTPDGEVIEQSVGIAQRSSQRVLGLVDALLDIARLQAGRMELAFEPVDLAHLIRQLILDFMPQAKAINAVLRADLPSSLPKIYADSTKIARVLTNLIDNAMKFTPSGGQIVVSASQREAGGVDVQVADDGPGIPEAYRERIFDQFSQVPGAKGRRRGSGLGLTFCRLTVEAHGGRIWVEPRPQGGSLFKFTLPVRPPAQPAAKG